MNFFVLITVRKTRKGRQVISDFAKVFISESSCALLSSLHRQTLLRIYIHQELPPVFVDLELEN
jgi:hypothetical protein